MQHSAEADITWMSGKVPAQDGVLGRASRKLVGEEGLLPELGPAKLGRELQKYIWNDKHHLSLRDIWEYLNRYTYLPRLKDRTVLVRAVASAISGMVPGPFAYAESWDETGQTYRGLTIDNAANVQVVINNGSVVVRPEVAEALRPAPQPVPLPLRHRSYTRKLTGR